MMLQTFLTFSSSPPESSLDFSSFFTSLRFFFNFTSPECSLVPFCTFFWEHFHAALQRSVSSFCLLGSHLPGESLQPLGELALVGAQVVQASISQAAGHLLKQGVGLLCGRSRRAHLPLLSFCSQQGLFSSHGKSCAGHRCRAPADGECASAFPQSKSPSAWEAADLVGIRSASPAGHHCCAPADGEHASAFPQSKCPSAWEAAALVGFRSASPPPQCQTAPSSCHGAEGQFLLSPVFFSPIGSSAYFLYLLDFSVPPCLQKMDSSAPDQASPQKCSLSLAVQRLLEGSNHGAWRNKSHLSLGLFLQPPHGFSLLLSFSSSTWYDMQEPEPALEARH